VFISFIQVVENFQFAEKYNETNKKYASSSFSIPPKKQKRVFKTT
jgi:hypothetical protein